MLLDMLNEQEAVTMRQSQLGSSIASLQEQLEQIVDHTQRAVDRGEPAARTPAEEAALRQLEDRIGAMQTQIQGWLDTRGKAQRAASVQDNESWAHLLSLLSAIQERVGHISVERGNAQVGLHARTLLDELEQEMGHLRGISEDIATLQWRLRRSLHERETNISSLRARASGGAD
jgi:alanyl-tRNA synthetase